MFYNKDIITGYKQNNIIKHTLISQKEYRYLSYWTADGQSHPSIHTWWSGQGAFKWPASQSPHLDNYFQLQLE